MGQQLHARAVRAAARQHDRLHAARAAAPPRMRAHARAAGEPSPGSNVSSSSDSRGSVQQLAPHQQGQRQQQQQQQQQVCVCTRGGRFYCPSDSSVGVLAACLRTLRHADNTRTVPLLPPTTVCGAAGPAGPAAPATAAAWPRAHRSRRPPHLQRTARYSHWRFAWYAGTRQQGCLGRPTRPAPRATFAQLKSRNWGLGTQPGSRDQLPNSRVCLFAPVLISPRSSYWRHAWLQQHQRRQNQQHQHQQRQ
jgi:hypothetical protein